MKTMRRVHGDLFVDVGANVGVYSLGLQRHFKKVIACEPNPWSRGKLLEKLHNSDSNVDVFPFALSDRDGDGELFLDDSPNRSSGSADTILEIFEFAPASNPESKKTFQGKNRVKVEFRSLDSLFHVPIDLVKIDVEGAEFLVLNGAKRLLGERKIRHLMIELHSRYRKAELEEIFRGYGYHYHWVDADHLFAEVY